MAKLKMGVLGTAVSGATGTAVFADTRYGTVVRSRPTVHDPNTLTQARQRYCFVRAQDAYRTLTRAENAAWKQYALSPLSADPNTGSPGGRTAYAAFLSLSMRLLALNPDAVPPHTPPPFPYAGDPVTFAVSALPRQIVLAASAPNSPQTCTVVQLLPLKFESQAYRLREMRVAAAHRFLPDALTLTLDAAPGWYVLATHFVHIQTGQWTASTEDEPFFVE